MQTKFIKTAILSDFTMATTVALVAGQYVDLMTMKIPAQQLREFGSSGIINGVDDRGVFKLSVNKAGPTNLPGSARLVVRDANGVVSNFIREDRSADLSTGVKVGETKLWAKQDSYLVIQYMPDASDTATKADSTASVPLTIVTL